MTPPIRISRACRPARSRPRNPAATRATPRSTATLASPRAQKLPWQLHYPSLVVQLLLRECCTTLDAKGTDIYMKVNKSDRLGLLTVIGYEETIPSHFTSDSSAFLQTSLQSVIIDI